MGCIGNVSDNHLLSRGRLMELKEHFREIIDSKRVFEKITSLADLKAVLRKRNCISELERVLNENQSNNNESFRNINPAYNNQRVLPEVPDDPVEQVDSVIAREIGLKWKLLARKLKISEGEIDAFDNRHPGRLEESVREILKHYREIHQSDWKIGFCNALTESRRRDLCYQIQDIFIRNKMM
ncbi:unnamed protein product [Phyllotreta striolata]|uniref:Death domain-containing protein n=1 Tax=Phyllotreta striolata TaxID=444603 RepID=A0A9N9TUQ6_PHYSR|nr:unnamed protein product [Phyllotreta striolata]